MGKNVRQDSVFIYLKCTILTRVPLFQLCAYKSLTHDNATLHFCTEGSKLPMNFKNKSPHHTFPLYFSSDRNVKKNVCVQASSQALLISFIFLAPYIHPMPTSPTSSQILNSRTLIPAGNHIKLYNFLPQLLTKPFETKRVFRGSCYSLSKKLPQDKGLTLKRSFGSVRKECI